MTDVSPPFHSRLGTVFDTSATRPWGTSGARLLPYHVFICVGKILKRYHLYWISRFRVIRAFETESLGIKPFNSFFQFKHFVPEAGGFQEVRFFGGFLHGCFCFLQHLL